MLIRLAIIPQILADDFLLNDVHQAIPNTTAKRGITHGSNIRRSRDVNGRLFTRGCWRSILGVSNKLVCRHTSDENAKSQLRYFLSSCIGREVPKRTQVYPH